MNGTIEDSLAKLIKIAERDDDYVLLTTPAGLNPCPICDSPVQLWQRKHEDQYHKVVACPNNGKKDSDYQCPCYFPPECYYHATRREAVAYWQKHSTKEELAPEVKSNEIHGSHTLRYSACNEYDVVCSKCNATDAQADRRLFYPCKES